MRKILRSHKEFTIPPLSLQEETILLKYEVANRLERVRDQHRELQEILDDDELMTLMNLTYLQENPSLYRWGRKRKELTHSLLLLFPCLLTFGVVSRIFLRLLISIPL
jgi:hypothetical protein